MIVSQSITHDSFSHKFFTWKFSNPIVDAFLLALVTTIFTYQLIALIFDLLLGFKKKGTATRTDILSVLIADEGTILGTLAGLLNNTYLLRLRYGLEPPNFQKLDLQPTVRRPRVVTKFIILVTTPAFVSVLSIALVQTYEKEVSFGASRFQGMALGIDDPSRAVKTVPLRPSCSKLVSNLDIDEEPIATFLRCSKISSVRPVEGPGYSFIKLTEYEDYRYGLLLEIPKFRMEDKIYVDATVKNVIFRLKGEIEEFEVRSILNQTISEIDRICESTTNAPIPNSTFEFSEEGGRREWRQTTSCLPETSKEIKVGLSEVFQQVTNRFMPKNSDTLAMAEVPGDKEEQIWDFRERSDLPFLKRTRQIASFALISSMTMLMIVLRIALKPFIANDIHFGIEVLLKEGLNLGRFDNLLSNNCNVEHSVFLPHAPGVSRDSR